MKSMHRQQVLFRAVLLFGLEFGFLCLLVLVIPKSKEKGNQNIGKNLRSP